MPGIIRSHLAHAAFRSVRVRGRFLRFLSAVAMCGLFAVPAAGQATPAAATAPASRPAEAGSDVFTLDAADIDDIKLLNLEVPTIITGTRHRQTIATAPYAVSVITAKDIRESGARSVPDALRQVPGVDVADISYKVSAVSPRGMTRYLSNHVLVLVDGRQIYDSMFGGTEWIAWPFQLEDIERIEVIRGTGGVTWGTNAVNGIINIVTRDPIDQLGLTTKAGGGSRGTAYEHGGYAFADEKLRLRISEDFERSDGYHKGGSLLFPQDDENTSVRSGVHAIYEAGPRDRLMISGGSGVGVGGLSPSPFSGYRSMRDSGTQAEFLMGKWTHDVAQDNSFEVTGYFNDLWFSQGIDNSDFRYQQFALQFSHTLKPAENHTLTWGIDTRADRLDVSGSDPYMTTRDYAGTGLIGLYAQDDWRFAPRWALNLGARLDYEFYGGFQPSGRAAISYEPARDALVYAAVARAFVWPAVGDRFQNEPLLRNLGRLTSHVDMGPTTAMTYELGYRAKHFGRLETSVDLYWNEYDNWASAAIRPGPPGLFRLDYDARVPASAYGVELGARYPVAKNLTLLGNYTFERLNWRGAAHPSLESDINTPPKHKFMLGTRYSPRSDLHLSAHLYYVDAFEAPNSGMPFFPRQVPTHFRLDLRAEYEFWKKQASVAVGVRNLLDANHYEGGTLFLNDAQVPRMIYAEIRFTIK